MKVAVLNFSGNVGKTTVAAQCLRPRLHDAPLFSIESLNQDAGNDGFDIERLRGKQFGALVDELMPLDSAIVDVGASNVEDFLKRMEQFDGSHEEFDFFVVPTVKERKVQADTVNTVRALQKLGIPANKIRLLFNKVEIDDNISCDFAPLFGLAQAERSVVVHPTAVIYANEVFERIKDVGQSLSAIAADPIDYRAKLRQTQHPDDQAHCVRMVALKRLAISANRNMDEVFSVLFS